MQIRSENQLLTFMVIVVSFIIAAMINVYPLTASYVQYRPMALILVLIFWSMYRPKYIGVFSALFVGLAADLLFETLLGQQAFCALLAVLCVRFSSQYVREFDFKNSWIVASISMTIFFLCLWIVQYISESYVMAQSFKTLIISVLCWLPLRWILKKYR